MPNPVKHQPRLDEDPTLNEPTTPAKTFYYRDPQFADLLERHPGFLDYPELRKLAGDADHSYVFPDDFIGSTPNGSAVPDDTKPEARLPHLILGGAFSPTRGNQFDDFLVGLLQCCNNYNSDLFDLRQELFRIRKGQNQTANAYTTERIVAFNQSAHSLRTWLEQHDPRLNNGNFKCLAVEFVKVNGYIGSIRAGGLGPIRTAGIEEVKEVQYSSSSHISMSSMFSSYAP